MNDDDRRCTAHSSRTGEPCKRAPIKGATVCASHGGLAPQVLRKAKVRAQMESDNVVERMVNIALHGKDEKTAIRAGREVLEVAGLKKHEIRVETSAWEELVVGVFGEAPAGMRAPGEDRHQAQNDEDDETG